MRSFWIWFRIVFAVLGWIGGIVLGLTALKFIVAPWYLEIPIAAFLGLIINNQVVQYLKGGTE